MQAETESHLPVFCSTVDRMYEPIRFFIENNRENEELSETELEEVIAKDGASEENDVLLLHERLSA